MTSYKNIKDKETHNMCLSYLKEITLGVGIKKDFSLDSIVLTNDVQDFEILNNRLLLLTRILYYLSIIQGKSLYLQKSYKTPEMYGLYERISEMTRAVRSETDILRTILSTAREQIKLK